MKRGQEALAAFSKARRDQPLGCRTHQVLALVHSQRRRLDAAIESAKDAIRLNPWNHEARLLLIRCLLGAGRLPEARAEFRRCSTRTRPAGTS